MGSTEQVHVGGKYIPTPSTATAHAASDEIISTYLYFATEYIYKPHVGVYHRLPSSAITPEIAASAEHLIIVARHLQKHRPRNTYYCVAIEHIIIIFY